MKTLRDIEQDNFEVSRSMLEKAVGGIAPQDGDFNGDNKVDFKDFVYMHERHKTVTENLDLLYNPGKYQDGWIRANSLRAGLRNIGFWTIEAYRDHNFGIFKRFFENYGQGC